LLSASVSRELPKVQPKAKLKDRPRHSL